ncbi:MAG: tryptophanyl-tRNA synthetase [Acidimicrobiaceae bacterium]|nr:tryptophanyl-tRNA synthetase [Acidimicrobiaceae bacterium]MDQ1421289.1 tryptophanyl-tRNA synthetase [Acidimicrobiaceae bacterium]
MLSGIQPTGDFHLGNYLGALRGWVEDQHEHDSYFCVVDLHALTIPRDPAELRAKSMECANLLLAVGLDPDVCTLFLQSHVPEHAELSWLLECTASMGELRRMTQFKEKTARGGEEAARVGLFTYPVLQAADILLYDADRVPVGDDQRQHLELTRDLATRFNQRYGETFVVPAAAIPAAGRGARIMDLQQPTAKMSKSAESPQGVVLLLDPPEAIERKVKRAVTDADTGTGSVRYDPAAKPGVSNLLELLGLATGRAPAQVAADYSQYGPLKVDTAAALVELLRPIQQRYWELTADPGVAEKALEQGADKAHSVASVTLRRARHSVGLLPRP